MTKRLFERCPNCETDLSNALFRYFWEQLPGTIFEYECGGCGATLEIDMEPIPQFYCTVKEATQLHVEHDPPAGGVVSDGS